MDLQTHISPEERVERCIAGQLARAERQRRRGIRLAVVGGAAAVVIATVAVVLGVVGGTPISARAEATVPPIRGAAVVDAGTAAGGPSVEETVATEAAAPSAADEPVADAAPKAAVPSAPATQRFTIRIGPAGYEPSVVRAVAKRPIVLTVGKGEGCAAGFLIPSLGIQKDNSSGPVTIKLGALKAGTYEYFCGMQMVSGRLVVS